MLSLCGGCEAPPSCLCAQTTSDTVTNRGTNCQPTSKERGHVRVDVPRPGTEREITQQRGTEPAGKHLARVLVWTTSCQDTELIPKTDKLGQTATKKKGGGARCHVMPFPSNRLNPFKSSGEDFLKRTKAHVQPRVGEGGICQRLLRLSSSSL